MNLPVLDPPGGVLLPEDLLNSRSTMKGSGSFELSSESSAYFFSSFSSFSY